ncbi:PEP-CTERM sorting domain-containing protein [Phycisphaerales bacterium AB-hyl4]|uniref:PEP-CTERM sorting domain-containing protein n=1 Tax=Natronomicrosphaera hydrolytica TaxID=3242702 RepID=A0ABV4U9P5_9BACT
MNRKHLSTTLTVAAAFGMAVASADAALVHDDFNRPNSNTVGTTSDGNDTWTEFEGQADQLTIRNNQLRFTHYATNSSPGLALTDLRLADGIIETQFDVIASDTSYARRSVINYRASSLANAAVHSSNNTFHVVVRGDWSTTVDLELYYGDSRTAGNMLASANISDDTAHYENPFSIRVSFIGNHHQVWIDDELLIDYIDPQNRNAEGAIGLSTNFTTMDVDYFTVIPEPASLALLGLGGLAMLGRRRNRAAQ